jgi:cyclohexyl-isocyanide hydratase
MSQQPQPFHITIPIYAGVDLLDVAAPVEIFSWMAESWKSRRATIHLVAQDLAPLKTRDGMILTPQLSFADYARQVVALGTNLLWVPGGEPVALRQLMQGGAYLDFLKAQAANADYVTSVCEGAMLLAAAGLLDGYEATTHWLFIPCFARFPAIKVAAGFPRYVVDGNRVTGGGISSGLDEALQLVALVAGEEIAKDVQMTTQYFPRPPFDQAIVPSTTCPLAP